MEGRSKCLRAGELMEKTKTHEGALKNGRSSQVSRVHDSLAGGAEGSQGT